MEPQKRIDDKQRPVIAHAELVEQHNLPVDIANIVCGYLANPFTAL